MGKREIGGGFVAAAAIAVAFLLPVTFPSLSDPGLALAWTATGIAFVVGLWMMWHRPKVHESVAPAWKSLRDYYEADFGLMKLGQDVSLTKLTGELISVHFQIHRDFNAHVDFASLYVFDHGEDVIGAVANHVAKLYEDAVAGVEISSIMPGESQATQHADIKFTGKVFVYHETHLEPQAVAKLIEVYKSRGFHMQLRGPSYATARNLSDRASSIPATAVPAV